MDIDLANYLQLMRQSHNWTLREVAGKTGLSISYLSDLERGRTLPSIETLEKLAAVYGMTLAIRFMDNYGQPYGYEMVNSKKWDALKQAFYALYVDE